MAFPTDPLDVRTEIQIAGAWVDVTSDTYTRSPITIERGTADEASVTEPSKCTLTLNNRSGKYSPRNPLSPYYGLIGRNTPLRVSVPGESYLLLPPMAPAVNNRASTPSAAALNVTADLDVRIDAQYDDWAATGILELIGRYDANPGTASWMLTLGGGAIRLIWSADGNTALNKLSPNLTGRLPESGRICLRATLDVNNGASGHTATFYTAPTMAGPWLMLGTPIVTAGTTSINNTTTAALCIGAQTAVSYDNASGRVYSAEVRNGIDGPLIANPDFTAKTPGTTSFSDTAGRAWTVSGNATVDNRAYRFTGEVSTWPTRWDVSGRDVWVPVEAAGILRRLGQGQKALDSTMRRRMPSYNPAAYWPMEDGADSVRAYSPVAGVAPLAVPGMSMSADDSLSGSLALPTIGTASSMTGTVPGHTANGWQIEFVYNIAAGPGALQTLLEFTTTGNPWSTWRLMVSASSLLLTVESTDGATTSVIPGVIPTGFFGAWNRFQLWATPNGANLDIHAGWITLGSAGFQVNTTVTAASAGRIKQIRTQFGSGLSGVPLGHLTVFGSSAISTFTGADTGFSGESALARIQRLASEESSAVAVTVSDGDNSTAAELMGPQRPGTLQSLIDECAETDGGILYERRDRLALHYRDRASLYNQDVAIPLDYTARGEVAPPLEPVEDDQQLRNDVTVARINGSSARVVVQDGPLSVQAPPLGVGVYDESVTLSLAGDGQPQQIAAWRTHLGTWDEARYPVITMWLHAAPHLILRALAMDIGDRLAISNPPPWLAPGLIDQHIRGYTEVLSPFEWTLAMNCAPAGAWQIGMEGDPVLARADTAGASLASAATSTATALSVATTVGPVWVTAAPNQVADPGFEAGTGTWVCSRGATIGVVSWERTIVHTGAGAARMTRTHATDTGSLNFVQTSTTYAAAAGQTWVASAWVYNGSATPRDHRMGLVWRNASAVDTFILGTITTATVGTWYRITVSATLPAGAVAVYPSVIGVGGWTVGEWWITDDVRCARTDTLTGTDMADEFPFAVSVGGEVVNVHGISGTSSPQTFYVDRSQNGIVKAQAAGTDVRLTYPTVASL